MSYKVQITSSPIGELYLVAKHERLWGIFFEKNWSAFSSLFEPFQMEETATLSAAKEQLAEYFGGHRRTFDLPFNLAGTPFQEKVWRSLQNIPYGETRSYKQQAESIGSPKAVRAVGRSNGLNRLCIVLPCHRIVGSDGSLTGFAGGLAAKKFLLQLEASHAGH